MNGIINNVNVLTGAQLCDRARRFRLSLGWSQDALAERTMLQQARISRLENSKQDTITFDEAMTLAKAFGLELSVFMDRTSTVVPKVVMVQE